MYILLERFVNHQQYRNSMDCVLLALFYIVISIIHKIQYHGVILFIACYIGLACDRAVWSVKIALIV